MIELHAAVPGVGPVTLRLSIEQARVAIMGLTQGIAQESGQLELSCVAWPCGCLCDNDTAWRPCDEAMKMLPQRPDGITDDEWGARLEGGMIYEARFRHGAVFPGEASPFAVPQVPQAAP